jgi:hypothetical protein
MRITNGERTELLSQTDLSSADGQGMAGKTSTNTTHTELPSGKVRHADNPRHLNPLYVVRRSVPLLGLTALAVQSIFQNGKGVEAAVIDTAGNGLSTGTSNAIKKHHYDFSRIWGNNTNDVLSANNTARRGSKNLPIRNTSLTRRQDPTYTPPPQGQGPVTGIGDFANNGPVTPETGKPVPNHTIQTPAQMQVWLSINFPQEKLRVDPSLLKDQLFFENTKVAHLSNYKLLEALKFYDPRDVYDALLLATGKDKFGVQSNPELAEYQKVRPNTEQSTAIVLAYWALSNHYGYIADLPKVESNPDVGLLVGKTPFPPLFFLQGGSDAGGVEKHGGRAWLNVANVTGSAQLAADSYHQLSRAITNDKWRSTAGSGALGKKLEEIGKSGYANYIHEIINEFLTRQWAPDFPSSNDASWNAQANMNAVVAALSRGDTQLRDEDFVDGPTPESSATGMDILRKAVIGGDDGAMDQVLQRFERLLESGRIPDSANQPNLLQTELPRLLASEDATDSKGLILKAILGAPVEQLQAVLNNTKTMTLLGERLNSEQALAYSTALFNYALEHSDLIGQRDLLDWFGGQAGEPNTFSGQLWCCDLPVFAAYRAGLKNKEEADSLHSDVCSGESFTQPWSPGVVPPVGNIVYYRGEGFHAAVSLGTTTPDGKAEVMSIALAAPHQNVHTQRTTIEDLRDEYPDDIISYGMPSGLKTEKETEASQDKGAKGELPLWAKIVIGLGSAAVLAAAAAAAVSRRRRDQADGVTNTPVSLVTVPAAGGDVINSATGQPVLPIFTATPLGGDVFS